MVRRLDRFIIFGHISAVQALRDSGLDIEKSPDRYGVLIGTGDAGVGFQIQNIKNTLESGMETVSPFYVIGTIPNTASGEKVKLFLTIPMGLNISHQEYWEGVLKFGVNKTTTWTLPTLSLGGEAEFAKNAFFRLSATPSWTRTVTTPLDFDATAGAVAETYVNAYAINTTLGLGFKLGEFMIDGVLSAAWFSDTMNNPLNRPAEIFNSAAGSPALPVFAGVQIKYAF